MYEDRNVKAKGLNKENVISETKLKEYFYDSDYDNLSLIKTIEPFELHVPIPTLFYPGCGVDILFPLHYLNALFPRTKEVHFVFMDTENTLGIIKTILDDVGISFSENKTFINFYWNNTLVNLEFKTANVFKNIDSLPQFHIYFERAFRIMRDTFPGYEEIIIKKLHNDGILISDSGFQDKKLQYKEVPKSLSSYNEMVLATK